MKEMLIKKWKEMICEFSQKLNKKEYPFDLSSDYNGLERYFYLCYEKEIASLELLIIKIASICFFNDEQLGKLDKVEFINLCSELRIKLLGMIKEVDENKYEAIINKDSINYNTITDLTRIGEILKSKNRVDEEYFKSYSVGNTNEENIIRIYKDGSNRKNFYINIGNSERIAELGFYRTGYTYRDYTNDDSLIQSVTRTIDKNEEIGHFDLRGYKDNIDEGWIGIYAR